MEQGPERADASVTCVSSRPVSHQAGPAASSLICQRKKQGRVAYLFICPAGLDQWIMWILFLVQRFKLLKCCFKRKKNSWQSFVIFFSSAIFVRKLERQLSYLFICIQFEVIFNILWGKNEWKIFLILSSWICLFIFILSVLKCFQALLDLGFSVFCSEDI